MLKIVQTSYGLHRKDLDFPFTLGLHRNSMRSSLTAGEEDWAYSSLPVTCVCAAKGGHVWSTDIYMVC